MNLDAIREQIPMLATTTYFNAGGIGPSPRPVTDVLIGLAREISEYGPDGMAFSREEFTQEEATRAKVARFFGAQSDEIALLRSTADGFSVVGHGLTWREGDEVIFGGGDHPAARAIWTILARRFGIRPVRFDLRNVSADEILEDIRRLITPRTKLISLSHVTSENGLRIPARRIADLAHEHGARLMLDGCQAVGQFPIDVHDLGCDFYAAGAYKWLLAPFGTAFLWVHPDQIAAIEPSWVGAGGAVNFDPEKALWEPLPSARKFEFGARYWPLVPAMGAALDFVSNIGLAAIEERSRMLVDRMCERLAGQPGVINFTPTERGQRSGMVGAAVEGIPGRELMEKLNACGIQLRANRGPGDISGVRLCCAFFLTVAEIDRVADAMADIAATVVRSR